MEWKNIYRGILMGTSDVVPGVSGGTIAVILGIYDQLIASINGIFTKRWKQHLSFLIPLAIGMAIAIFSLARLMDWLLAEYPVPTYFFFLGLIIGVLPYLFQEADVRMSFRWIDYLLLIIGILLVGSLLFVKGPSQDILIKDRSFFTLIFFFASGFLASAAMILPGISGSFVLLVLGVYHTVMNAISNLDLVVIIITGLGIFSGIIGMSKIINYFLSYHRTGTFALIIGLVIGSIFVIFPGWPVTLPSLLSSIATFGVGLLAAYILGKVEYKEE